MILVDSLIKHTNGWETAKTLNTECKVFVRTFPGATTHCLRNYMKALMRTKPNHFVVHVGANHLNSNASPDKISKTIIYLALELKSEKPDDNISLYIMRAEKPALNKKMKSIFI